MVTENKLFLNIMEADNLLESIKSFVDNDTYKIGKIQKYGDLEFSIISVEELKSYIHNEGILITCGDVAGIKNQLDLITELENVECYSMSLMLSRDDSKTEFLGVKRQKKQACIPKKIHYCWFGKNKIPKEYQKWMDSWRKYCPDYEIIEWNETNYDWTKNRYMREAYEMGKWGFVPDYARLDIIYQYGGIYLDTDVELLHNLDELLFQEAFSICDTHRHVNLGNGFGAIPKHPLIKELRDYYENQTFIDENGKCNLTTCALYQHEVLKKYGFKLDGNFQVIQGMTVYPASINGVDTYSHLQNITRNTYFMHYGTATWSTKALQEAREHRRLFFKEFL